MQMLQLCLQMCRVSLQRGYLRLQSADTLRMLLLERYTIRHGRHYLRGQLINLLIDSFLQMIDSRFKLQVDLLKLLIPL